MQPALATLAVCTTALAALVLWMQLRRTGRRNEELRATNQALRRALAHEQALRIATEPPPDEVELTREQRKRRLVIIRGTGIAAIITASAAWVRDNVLRSPARRIAASAAAGAAVSLASVAAFAVIADGEEAARPPTPLRAVPTHDDDSREAGKPPGFSPSARPSSTRDPMPAAGGESPLAHPGPLTGPSRTSPAPLPEPSETSSPQTRPPTALPSASIPGPVSPSTSDPGPQPEETPTASPTVSPSASPSASPSVPTPSPKDCFLEIHVGGSDICLIPEREP